MFIIFENIYKLYFTIFNGKIFQDMNKFVIKYIVVFSLILGVILGMFAPVPYVGIMSLFAALLLAAPLVIIYLIMDSKFD